MRRIKTRNYFVSKVLYIVATTHSTFAIKLENLNSFHPWCTQHSHFYSFSEGNALLMRQLFILAVVVTCRKAVKWNLYEAKLQSLWKWQCADKSLNMNIGRVKYSKYIKLHYNDLGFVQIEGSWCTEVGHNLKLWAKRYSVITEESKK